MSNGTLLTVQQIVKNPEGNKPGDVLFSNGVKAKFWLLKPEKVPSLFPGQTGLATLTQGEPWFNNRTSRQMPGDMILDLWEPQNMAQGAPTTQPVASIAAQAPVAPGMTATETSGHWPTHTSSTNASIESQVAAKCATEIAAKIYGDRPEVTDPRDIAAFIGTLATGIYRTIQHLKSGQ